MSKRKIAFGIGLSVAILVLLSQLGRYMRSGVGDPGELTEFRLFALQDSISAAPSPPRTLDDVLGRFSPAERGNFRRDGYGNEIRYTVHGNQYALRSAGEDGAPGTRDDHVVVDTFPVR
jgi:hypothetical protein